MKPSGCQDKQPTLSRLFLIIRGQSHATSGGLSLMGIEQGMGPTLFPLRNHVLPFRF
ncbi:hypothetical protein UYSO10_1668 [Kosakonia radicincitans]|nr:hypothetical protein UYSO10_1668 [Kosakonia radicincitans]